MQELDWLVMCLKEVFDTLDRPVTIVDREGRFVYYNRASARMDGIDGDHLIGRHVLDVNPWLRPEDSTLLACLHDYARFTDSMQMFIGPGGQPIPYLHTAMPLFGRSGDLIGAIEIGREARFSRVSPGELPLILTADPVMQQEISRVDIFGASELPILIYGETGTGKELIANAIHYNSPRARNALVKLNCAALPENLLESELFGHEKGAFTGAVNRRRGLFEQADGGTLFLDEIGDMPLDVQTRLLRVLADGQFYRVGGYAPVKVDVRIIAATHQNLEQRVQEGKFREDLFHRLNVIRVHLPPLRERREDIPRLARHFLQVAARELGVETKLLHPETEAALTRLAWPGNVRQLENTCRWLTVMAAGQEVLIQDLPSELFETVVPDSPSQALPDSWATLLAQWADRALRSGHQNLLSEAQPEMERTLLTTALRHTQGHKQEAARLLGWGRNTLTRKLKELGME